MNIEGLYENPVLYDAECAAVMKDKNFWKKVINGLGNDTVLEIGCGTGRIAEYIIDDIESYDGIDLSDVFLDCFREKEVYQKHNDKITLIKGDIREYVFYKQYDVIILTSQFLGHLYSLDDLYKTFANIKKALSSEGEIIIDYCNPDLRFLENHKSFQFCYEFYSGTDSVKVYERNCYDQCTQINHQERKYLIREEIAFIQNIPFRIYFPQELDALLKLSGFEIEKKYGDYDLSEFEEYCVKQIYVLKKSNKYK